MMVARAARWLDDRLGGAQFARTALNKVFPDHWSFMLGEITLYCFIILVATGTFLGFFFRPDPTLTVYDGSYDALRGVPMSQAYESVIRLSFDVRAGLVMRQMHHWAALLFVATGLVHLLRVFFTGAFRRPRELNWIIGVTLFLLGIFNGFTGYSLPDDLLSGTGLRIAYSIALSVPFIGVWLAFLVFGGEFPAPDILSRLYTVHVFLVPAAIATLIGAHLFLVVRQKHTQFPRGGRTEHNVVGDVLWPTYAAKATALFLFVAAIVAGMGGLLEINPVWLWGPFEPALETSTAQPDWYMGWVEGALRIFPAWEFRTEEFAVPNPFYPGALLPGITFLVIYAWPFIEARFTKDNAPHHLLDRPRDVPWRTAFGAAVLAFYAVLFVAGALDIISRRTELSVRAMVWMLRAATIALPPLVFLVVYRICDALRRSGKEHTVELSVAEVVRRREAEEHEEAAS